jgi:hypothetical protein
MRATCSYHTTIYSQRATPHCIPEEINLHNHCYKNFVLQLHFTVCSIHWNAQLCKQGNNSVLQVVLVCGSVRFNSWTSSSSSHPDFLRFVLTLSYHLLLDLERIFFHEFSPSKSDHESDVPIRIACFSVVLNWFHTTLKISDVLSESSLLYNILSCIFISSLFVTNIFRMLSSMNFICVFSSKF